MFFALSALLISSAFSSVKAEMLHRYPTYRQQIAQVGMPSVGYRERLMFSVRHMRFMAGRCDLFAKPQVIVVRDRNNAITMFRLRHELSHFVAFAAGLPVKEHERIDR
jgi:predicted acetyltransferase